MPCNPLKDGIRVVVAPPYKMYQDALCALIFVSSATRSVRDSELSMVSKLAIFLCSLQVAFLSNAFVADAAVVTDSIASQYIHYEGAVSASTNWDSSVKQPTYCQDVTLGPYNNSRLYVGVNPPWDKNPFFFDLYHHSSEGGSVVFSFTKDRVYNLEFTSAALSCFSGNDRCAAFASNYYFLPDTALDLTKAKIQTRIIESEPGYTVSGDSSAWISNGTLDVNSVDVAAYCYEAWSWKDTIWNNTMPFNWEMSITNNSASFSITTTPAEKVGSMTISFFGKRLKSSSTAYPPQGVQLDTSNPLKPQFKFVDGNDIFFHDRSGRWRAYNNARGTAEKPSSTSTSLLSTQRPTSSTTRPAAAITSTGAASRVTFSQGSMSMGVILSLSALLGPGLGAEL